MATPRLSRHRLDGACGEILVDVRAASREAAPAVVLVHGFKGFKDWGFFPPFADRLARAGFTVVSFNSSGSGVDDDGEFTLPERFGRNTFSADLNDLEQVLAALDGGRLERPPPSSVGLVGHSRGGGLSILAAAGRPRIGALVTWASIAHVDRWSAEMRTRWREAGFVEVRNQRTGLVLPLYPDVLDDIEANGRRLDIAAAAARISCPWLVLHGRNDETVPFNEAESLAASAAGPVLVAIDHTGHTFGAVHPFAGLTPALSRVFDASVAHLSQHLT